MMRWLRLWPFQDCFYGWDNRRAAWLLVLGRKIGRGRVVGMTVPSDGWLHERIYD